MTPTGHRRSRRLRLAITSITLLLLVFGIAGTVTFRWLDANAVGIAERQPVFG